MSTKEIELAEFLKNPSSLNLQGVEELIINYAPSDEDTLNTSNTEAQFKLLEDEIKKGKIQKITWKPPADDPLIIFETSPLYPKLVGFNELAERNKTRQNVVQTMENSFNTKGPTAAKEWSITEYSPQDGLYLLTKTKTNQQIVLLKINPDNTVTPYRPADSSHQNPYPISQPTTPKDFIEGIKKRFSSDATQEKPVIQKLANLLKGEQCVVITKEDAKNAKKSAQVLEKEAFTQNAQWVIRPSSSQEGYFYLTKKGHTGSRIFSMNGDGTITPLDPDPNNPKNYVRSAPMSPEEFIKNTKEKYATLEKSAVAQPMLHAYPATQATADNKPSVAPATKPALPSTKPPSLK